MNEMNNNRNILTSFGGLAPAKDNETSRGPKKLVENERSNLEGEARD
jgi:hypothetical protein